MMSTESVSQEKHEKPLNKDGNPALKKPVFSQAIIVLKQTLSEQENPEEKLRLAIEFMKQSLAQEGTPRFKDFWDAKNICLPLFKEKLSQSIKEVFWAKYTELATEAKRLKEILEEQASFAMEQIELALKALACEVEQKDQHSMHEGLSYDLPLPQSSLDLYRLSCGLIKKYVQLTFKLKALREEVLSTEMRARHKSRFLKEMSELGDTFIPKKKELIRAVSLQFVKDIEEFVHKHFDMQTKTPHSEHLNLRQLRDHIQSLQEVAKKLSLNAYAFSQSRELLSQAWELMRSLDKEKKKQMQEKKVQQEQILKQGMNSVEQAVACFKEQPAHSEQEVLVKKEAALKAIDALDLNYHEKKQLKAKLFAECETYLKPFHEKKAALEEHKKQQQAQKSAELEQYKDLLKSYVLNHNQTSYHDLMTTYESFNDKRKEFSLSKADAAYLEEIRRELYETILLKRENELEQDQESLQKLYADWETFKEQTRERLELYRKEESFSGFDFQKAMIFRELKDLEKARLDRAVEKLQQLQDQLD